MTETQVAYLNQEVIVARSFKTTRKGQQHMRKVVDDLIAAEIAHGESTRLLHRQLAAQRQTCQPIDQEPGACHSFDLHDIHALSGGSTSVQ